MKITSQYHQQNEWKYEREIGEVILRINGLKPQNNVFFLSITVSTTWKTHLVVEEPTPVGSCRVYYEVYKVLFFFVCYELGNSPDMSYTVMLGPK